MKNLKSQVTSIAPATKQQDGSWAYPAKDKEGKVIGYVDNFPNDDQEFDEIVERSFEAI